MEYLLDEDSLYGEGGKICKIDNLRVELSEREELKLDELEVPKLQDKENLSSTVTIDPKDQPDIEKMFPQMKLIDELWNKLQNEKTSLDTIQQFADKLGVELNITIAPKQRLKMEANK